jgi:trimethylamine--corrinoid protein Co-methyltransferase
MLNGYTRTFKPLEMLSNVDLERIHRGALYVLEKTGMRVEHDRALELFADNHCKVDFEDKRVRIPGWIAEESLRKTPSSYTVTARDDESDLVIGGDTFYFMQGMGMRHVDLETWETSKATLSDHKEATIVADALESCHMADAVFSYTEFQGVPGAMTFLEALASGLRYSGKAQHYGYQKDCERFAIKMAQVLGVNLEPEVDTASPLTIYGGSVEATFQYVEAGFPIQPCVGLNMGGEAPSTMAGALVQLAATVMGWVTLIQLIRPGAPLSIQAGLKPMDMRRGSPLFGSVVYSMNSIALNQLLRSYRIPICCASGFTSTSKKIDFQSGYERSMGALSSALSGGSLQIFHGGSSSELVYNDELAILDDDVAGWIGHMLQGIQVNDETLAVDLINKVGPIPGHFLSSPHTREWHRQENFFPKSADQEAYPVWLKEGKKDALELAKERKQDILKNHKYKPLSDEKDKAIEDIMDEARSYYRDKNMISDEEWTDYQKVLNP